jgi:hypothetical protein
MEDARWRSTLAERVEDGLIGGRTLGSLPDADLKPSLCARQRLQDLSKNQADSGRLGKTAAESRPRRKPWDSRTIATKDERHHRLEKCRLPRFETSRAYTE